MHLSKVKTLTNINNSKHAFTLNMVQKYTQKGSEELRKKLGRGDLAEIARTFGITKVWAERVVSGKDAGDPQIIEMALEMADLEEKKRLHLSQLIERNKEKLENLAN